LGVPTTRFLRVFLFFTPSNFGAASRLGALFFFLFRGFKRFCWVFSLSFPCCSGIDPFFFNEMCELYPSLFPLALRWDGLTPPFYPSPPQILPSQKRGLCYQFFLEPGPSVPFWHFFSSPKRRLLRFSSQKLTIVPFLASAGCPRTTFSDSFPPPARFHQLPGAVGPPTTCLLKNSLLP